MKVLYLTQEGIHLTENGKTVPLPSYRLQQYKATIEQIHQDKLWKTTGKGARFMGIYQEEDPQEAVTSFCGLALYQDEFLYTLQLDASGGLYKRSFSEKAEMEGHICSGNDVRLGDIACHGEDVAACVRYPDGRVHIGLYHLPASYCTEITDGDSCESAPSWSPDGRILYFSTAGIARQNGRVAAFSPRSGVAYSVNSERMETILEDERFDYLSVKEDAQGNLWYIRQPYKASEEDERNSLKGVCKDVVLFPYRIVKGIFGFLNAFTTLFGGEALRSGGKQHSDVKSKQKSDKELFFEGNLIKAEKNLKENTRKGENYPGILPRSRVLIRRTPDGTEEIIAKGVLDYTLRQDGSVVYSNGSHILHRTAEGNTENLVKEKLASRLQVVE